MHLGQRHRRRLVRLRALVRRPALAGKLGVIVGDQPVAVEAEIIRVGADVADHVGGAGQVLAPAFFDGFEINRLDVGDGGNGRQVLADLFAAATEHRADFGQAAAGRPVRF